MICSSARPGQIFVVPWLVAALLRPSPAAAAAGVPQWLIPPVDGPVTAPFDPPKDDYGAGHRGIDYGVSAGTGVRAAGPGTIVFAGRVASTLAVTVDHGAGLESTYTALAALRVAEGQSVDAGTWLGESGQSHAGGKEGLHFGVKLNDRYVDPMSYLGPLDLGAAIHLAPVVEHPEKGVAASACIEPAALGNETAPPDDNVAVLIGGIGSHTRRGAGPGIFHHGGANLGYPAGRTYHYSYKGVEGSRLHADYDQTDTYGDLRQAGKRLEALLVLVARRHPGRDVDLIAHSQGGIVARVFLEQLARAWDPSLPRVEHLVTFSSPHGGAPLATSANELEHETLTGGLAMGGLGWLSQHGLPIPDPRVPAIQQLAADSELMTSLAAEDIVYGTRALTLAIPNDLVVPANRALLAGERGRVVSPEGMNGHSQIVRSAAARRIAYSFLRGAPPSCEHFWDIWGPRVGAAVAWPESKLGWAVGRAEDASGLGVVRWARNAVALLGRMRGR